MSTYLSQFADALQAPLRNALCLDPRVNLDRLLTVGLSAIQGNLFPYFGQGLVWPTECGFVPPQTDNPILDGQCQNVLYRVNVRTIFPDGTARDIEFTNVVGPLRSIGTFWQSDFFGNLRAGPELLAPNDPEGTPPGVRRFGPYSTPIDNDRGARSLIVSVVRQDGQPDNCGNPPVPPTPPPLPPVQISLPPFTFSAGPFNVNVNASAVFAPAIFAPFFGGILIPVQVTIGPNSLFPGGAKLPIYLNFPDLTINAPISLFPINQTTLEQGGGTPSELPYVERIVGLNIGCDISPSAKVTLIAGDGNQPNLVLPRAGVVRFYVPGFISNLVSTDVDIKSVNQFVQCPNPSGAVGFEVFPNPGVTISATPVQAEILELVRPS